jgi:hypothetical protein
MRRVISLTSIVTIWPEGVVSLAGGEHPRERSAASVGGQMNLGRYAAAGAAQRCCGGDAAGCRVLRTSRPPDPAVQETSKSVGGW